MSATLAHAPARTRRSPVRAVSRSHDAEERQAEHAAQVVAAGGRVAGWSFSGAAPAVQRCGGPGGHCGCEACSSSVDEALESPAAPLDAASRRFMEAGFGADFGAVRIHADERAATSARALGASAYTVGEHVVAAAGTPDVGTEPGRRLLAHELAHVMQNHVAGNDSAVRRQAAPAGPAPAPAAPTRPRHEERFGLGRGRSRVDAELDREAVGPGLGWLTAKMKVLFNFVNTPKAWPSPARQNAWRDSFIRTVTQRWSFKHFLVPERECPGEPRQVAVRLQVIPVTSGQHFTMTIGYTDTFRQSSVSGGTASLDVLDVERRSAIPQTPAEHEFGHMLGLPHIHCASNDQQCYGVTREEKADIMGSGSFVSPRDYEPFAELMPYFTGCNWRVVQASYIPTSRGPLIGGLIGGALGLIGGALLGSLLGPIGAIVGGLVGLAAGAGLGTLIGTPEVPS